MCCHKRATDKIYKKVEKNSFWFKCDVRHTLETEGADDCDEPAIPVGLWITPTGLENNAEYVEGDLLRYKHRSLQFESIRSPAS